MAKKTSPVKKAVKKPAGKQKARVKTPRPAADLKRQIKIQKALYEIADAASAVRDMQSFYKKMHEIVGELMYAGNFYIATYDEQSGLLSFPYFVDEVEPARPTQPLADYHGMTSWVIRTGNMIMHGWNQSNELLASGEIRLPDAGPPNEDGIAAPLKVDGKTIGVVFVQSYTKGIEYTDEDEDVLEFVAQHVATALTRVRAIEETRQRNSELQIINSVQAGLASKLDMQGIYDLVGDRLREIFSAQIVVMGTYDQATDLLQYVYAGHSGLSEGVMPAEKPDVFERYLLSLQEPLVINENFKNRALELGIRPLQEDPTVALEDQLLLKSFLAIPLLAGKHVIGIISLQDSHREHVYSPSDVRLLQTLANSMSVALENARLFDETQRLLKETEQRNAELAILNSVGEAMAKTLDVKTVTKIVGDKVRDIFDADQMGILLFDKRTNLIHVIYGYDKAHDRYMDGVQIKPIPLGQGLTSKVIELRQPLLLSTREEQEVYGHYMPPELVGQIKMSESWLGVPIMVDEDVLGAVFVEEYRPYAYHENHLRLLQTLSSNMGIAIQNARLFDETQRLLKETEDRAAELAVINSVQEGLASKLDMQEIYELVGEKIREIFRNADTNIRIYDPKTNLLHISYSYVSGQPLNQGMSMPMTGSGFSVHVLRTHETLVINENMEQEMERYGSIPIPGVPITKSAVFVPLVSGGEGHGMITLFDIEREHAFSESDVRLLETLANSMSVALENARLWEQEKLYRKALEREFEIGREIQAGFLPDTLPQPKGWEIAASLKSAREVAGDFYDVFELPNDKIGLVIADVCDKGLGAALFMTLFRSLIRAVSNVDFFVRTQTDELDSSALRLKNAISLTNNYIAETHGDTGMFATIFFGILDPRTGVLTYINGGHLPPMLVNAQGVKEVLKFTGPAVGAMADVDYVIKEAMIEQGESLFAYTDGLTDTENLAGESFNANELIPLLIENQSLSPMLEEIQKRIADHAAGAKQFDDITMLAVRRTQTTYDSQG